MHELLNIVFLCEISPSSPDWGKPRPCSGAVDGRGGVGFCPTLKSRIRHMSELEDGERIRMLLCG
jgi:hypothetical protein